MEWHSDPVEKVDTGTMGGVLMCSRWMHVEVVPLYIIPLRALNHNRLISRRLMRNPLRNLIPIALRTYRSSPIWHQPVLSTCLFSSSVHSRSLQLTSVRLRSNPLDCVRSPSTCLVPSSFLPTLFYFPSSTASFLSRPNILHCMLHASQSTRNCPSLVVSVLTRTCPSISTQSPPPFQPRHAFYSGPYSIAFQGPSFPISPRSLGLIR